MPRISSLSWSLTYMYSLCQEDKCAFTMVLFLGFYLYLFDFVIVFLVNSFRFCFFLLPSSHQLWVCHQGSCYCFWSFFFSVNKPTALMTSCHIFSPLVCNFCFGFGSDFTFLGIFTCVSAYLFRCWSCCHVRTNHI